MLLLASGAVFYYNSKPTIYVSPYPDGKNFAFTITDDPDETRLEKIKPIYEFLDSLGIKTTIACWIFKPRDLARNPDPQEQLKSETLENPGYLRFLKDYQRKGFEISLHTVTSGNDKREDTIKGYERFNSVFGTYPKINIMHSKNLENIYWGKNVFENSLLKSLVGLYDNREYGGENTKGIYFWGDICKGKTKYVRLWGTSDINTLKFNPSMPYHDTSKPYVNYWFPFSDGYSGKYFTKLLSSRNIDKLVKERGACIVYAHFAAGFSHKTKVGYLLDDTIKNELLYLSNQKEGWFVPCSILLDRLSEIKNISLVKKGYNLEITNLNPIDISGITLVTRPFLPYRDYVGKLYQANGDGEILVGELKAGQKKTIYITEGLRLIKKPSSPNFLEQSNLIWERLKILIFDHRN